MLFCAAAHRNQLWPHTFAFPLLPARQAQWRASPFLTVSVATGAYRMVIFWLPGACLARAKSHRCCNGFTRCPGSRA